VYRHHDNFCVDIGAGDIPGGLNPADAWHIHVHQDNISGKGTAPFYGVFTATGLTGNFNTLYIFKNASYPCAHQLVVINKKNVDQWKVSRIGITLWNANSVYITVFSLNFKTVKMRISDTEQFFGN
jgi:hypothetical protein